MENTLNEKDRTLLGIALRIANEQYGRDAESFDTLPEPARDAYRIGAQASAKRVLELADMIEQAEDIILSAADVQPEEAADTPEPLQMAAIVCRLAELGIPSFVEGSGGNVATLYAGEPPSAEDANELGYQGYPAVAGPGWFEHHGLESPAVALADPRGFMVAPEGSDAAPTYCTTVEQAVSFIQVLVAQASGR